jgi:hypothetical protein
MYPGHSGSPCAPIDLIHVPIELAKEFVRALAEGPDGLKRYALLVLQITGAVGLGILQEVTRRRRCCR